MALKLYFYYSLLILHASKIYCSLGILTFVTLNTTNLINLTHIRKLINQSISFLIFVVFSAADYFSFDRSMRLLRIFSTLRESRSKRVLLWLYSRIPASFMFSNVDLIFQYIPPKRRGNVKKRVRWKNLAK